MKKFFVSVACFVFALTSLAFFGCGKVVEIKTKYPESFKVVTESVNTAGGSYTENNYTLIAGKYNGKAVVYLKEIIVIDHGDPTTREYLWIANDESTKANELMEDLDLGTYITSHGYREPTKYTLGNYLFDVKATGSYNEKKFVSQTETECVYKYDGSDTIYFSNDEYHLTNKRVQTLRNWTNTYSFGDYTASIPHIADIVS